MSLLFEPINIEKQDLYLKYLAKCPQKASDYSFVNLWAWADEYGLRWTWEDDLVWIRQTRPLDVNWAPVGAWESIDWKNLNNRFWVKGASFIRVPDKLLQYWKSGCGSRLQIYEARGHWDYLYSVAELTQLKGNRYHKKKNLLNQYRKKYNYTYAPMGTNNIPQALDMQNAWCTWRDCESSETLSAENSAIESVFKAWNSLKGLIGGTLMVEQKITAYTVAESLPDETLLIHFEKADPEYKGGYQAINQMFLNHMKAKFTTVNREQDLDDEGFRKAKRSYHPVDFLRKFKVVLE